MMRDKNITTSGSVLINGENNQYLLSTDRGLSYGDGLFETIQVNHNKPLLWKAHMLRMRSGAKRLNIPFDDSIVRAFANDFKILKSATPSNNTLKLTITRGVGQRGYKADPNATITRVAALSAMPDMSAQQSNGVVVQLCNTQLARQPQLAGLKHLNRLEQVLARNEWDDPGITEGIVCDTQGFIVEGCMSNVFWVCDGVLYTPDLNYAGVEGVIRNAIIEICKECQLICVKQGEYKIPDILASDEIFVCNSLFNILPVVRITSAQDTFTHKELSVGSVTKKLQQLLLKYYLRKDEF